MTDHRQRARDCGIPANGGSIGGAPCDLEWGHDGEMHANAGDGFYSRTYENEHRFRQHIRERVDNFGARSMREDWTADEHDDHMCILVAAVASEAAAKEDKGDGPTRYRK